MKRLDALRCWVSHDLFGLLWKYPETSRPPSLTSFQLQWTGLSNTPQLGCAMGVLAIFKFGRSSTDEDQIKWISFTNEFTIYTVFF